MYSNCFYFSLLRTVVRILISQVLFVTEKQQTKYTWKKTAILMGSKWQETGTKFPPNSYSVEKLIFFHEIIRIMRKPKLCLMHISITLVSSTTTKKKKCLCLELINVSVYYFSKAIQFLKFDFMNRFGMEGNNYCRYGLHRKIKPEWMVIFIIFFKQDKMK